MTRKRPGYFQALFDLAIGEEMVIQPRADETVEKALTRIKARIAKWGRGYRMKVRRGPDEIVIQRISEEHTGSASDWFMMPPNTTLLLKTNPTDADVRKAKRMASHLTNDGSRRKKVRRPYGQWVVLPVVHNELVIWCQVNESLAPLPDRFPDAPPNERPRRLWAGDWP